MARESFDKEIQFLRMLVLTSGAYTRSQLADRLGVSIPTVDKTIRNLKEAAGAAMAGAGDAGLDLADQLRYSYHGAADPMLLFLFRAKSVKASESVRIPLLLGALKESSLTVMELLDFCCAALPADLAAPDEKTIRSDLKYLEEVGVICKAGSGRPSRYRLNDDLIRELSAEELLDLYDFVDIMANTQIPSVQGYLLREGLQKHLSRSAEPGAGELASFGYKYHYYSRILDEAHLFPILSAIRERRRISFLYFSPKTEKSYSSRNTNPLFEKEAQGRKNHVLPLKVVYDHQYGRWYLLGWGKGSLIKFRLEGIIGMDSEEAVSEDEMSMKIIQLEDAIRYSWLIDTGRPIKVRARFFNPGAGFNFVRERVLLQGQWGEIVEEEQESNSFLYEIVVNGITEIKPWLRSFGSSCEIVEPRHLRAQMIQEWKEIASYYESV
ncbi:helix-turn-helix transcriptional regulator [Paenibacillus humicus]|uniref:helix-turn-helix transcriptional regulator n=1 Tax=Paenibacillus humicus TaxID=412861 RepID=UPI000FD6DA3B|nr:WYL domain-containing protein [Paenibacillus humicus]